MKMGKVDMGVDMVKSMGIEHKGEKEVGRQEGQQADRWTGGRQ
jgi:hypothetical protein